MLTFIRVVVAVFASSLLLVAQEPPPAAPPAPSDTARDLPSKAHEEGSWRDDESRHRHRDSALHGEIVSLGKDAYVAADQTMHSVVVIGGNLIVDGEVDEVVVIAGDLTLNGKVRRDSVTVLGAATFGSNAVVRGEAVVVGGELQASPGAQFQRSRREFALVKYFPKITWLGEWFRYGLLWGRPLPHQFPWAWALGLIAVAVYVLAAMIAPASVNRSAASLEHRPVGSLVVGFFVLLLFVPILGLLIASIIGVLAAPFLVCAFVAAIVLGKAAVCQLIGRRIFANTILHPAVLALTGAVVLLLCYFVPVLGFLVWGLVATLGIGSAVIAAFSGRRANAIRPAVAPAGLPRSAEALGAAATPDLAAPPAAVHLSAEDLASGAAVGFWMRLAATGLDAVLFAGISAVLHLNILLPVLWFAYHIVMWAWKSTTIGGIILGLQLVRIDGRPMDWSTAAVRGLAAFLSGAVFFLGFFWVGWDRNRQSWHDKIAGTVVVKASRGVALV